MYRCLLHSLMFLSLLTWIQKQLAWGIRRESENRPGAIANRTPEKAIFGNAFSYPHQLFGQFIHECRIISRVFQRPFENITQLGFFVDIQLVITFELSQLKKQLV